jgi:hypothetical protein
MRAVVVAVASVIVSGFLSVPAVAHADACVNGTVQRGGSGDDYFLCQGGAWLTATRPVQSLQHALVVEHVRVVRVLIGGEPLLELLREAEEELKDLED